MSTRLYTDVELTELRSMLKRVNNPGARWLDKPKVNPVYRQRGFRVSGQQDEEMRFFVYQRQNLADETDFSCGILYLPLGGPSLMLARYNGPSHRHGIIAYRPHVHHASERAISAGRKAESEAEETDRFASLEGALYCLIQDFGLTGINAQPDEPRLFP